MKITLLSASVLALSAVPALAQQPAQPAYEPGLIGSVLAPDGAALWDYPLPGAAWPYQLYAGTAPSPGLLTTFPTRFAGMLDLPSAGDWGVRLRVEFEDGYTRAKSCAAKISVEGTDIVSTPLRPEAAAATATISIPEPGLYAVAGSLACTDGAVAKLAVNLEVKAPGRDTWERATVRREAKPTSAPATSSAVVIRRGGNKEAAVKWVQSVRRHERDFTGAPGTVGEIVAEVPQSRADVLPLRGYPGEVTKPDNSRTSAGATLTTIQTVGEAGRWFYYLAMEQTAAAGDSVRGCLGSISVEGQAIVPMGWFAQYLNGYPEAARQEYGPRWGNKESESLALVGAADLMKGEYKLTVTADCLPRVPAQVRVWVKGPSDAALRPLRADEVAVQVAAAAPTAMQPGGSSVTMTVPAGPAPVASTPPGVGGASASTTSAADIAGKLKVADATIDLTVTFATGSDVIEDQGRTQIAEIAAALRQLDTISVQVEGHTDAVGDDGYNLDLSKRRAAAVVKELTVIHRIDPARLSSTGYGKAKPIADNATEDGRAKNRRVTIRRLNSL